MPSLRQVREKAALNFIVTNQKVTLFSITADEILRKQELRATLQGQHAEKEDDQVGSWTLRRAHWQSTGASILKILPTFVEGQVKHAGNLEWDLRQT